MRAAMTDLLGADIDGNGEKVTPETLKAAAQRVLLSHFRLGFYDAHAADYPFGNSTLDYSLLNGPAHRTLAREAAAKSTVLLKNKDQALPLPATGGPKSIAVVGPFAACMSSDPEPADLSCKGRGGCESQCYLHSYNGFPTNTTSIFGGIAASAKTAGV